ncbi:hypothetical protein ACWD0Z_39215 [Streptomyces sp. NPDC003007]
MSTSRSSRTRMGSAEQEAQRMLRNEHHDEPDNRDGSQSSNGELAIFLMVANTVTDIVRKATRMLARGEKKLARTAGRASRTMQRIKVEAADVARPLRTQAHTDRQREATDRDFDPDQPLVSRGFLAASEVALALGEAFFWANTFSNDIDSTVPAFGQQRLGAYVLAVLLPLAGIIAARWAGATWQRLLRHPAPDRQQRRSQQIGAAVSLGLLASITTAIYALVRWRFDASPANLGAVAIPGAWMALIFAGIIIADAIARTFLVSEQADQDRRHETAWKKDQRQTLKAAARRTAAEERWNAAWLALRSQTHRTLDQVQEALYTGSWLITRHRALDEHGPDTRPAPPSPASQPARPGGLLLPRPEPVPVLDLPDVNKALRAVEAAVDTLRAYEPPSLRPEHQLDSITTLLATLQNAQQPAPAGGTPPQTGTKQHHQAPTAPIPSPGETDGHSPAALWTPGQAPQPNGHKNRGPDNLFPLRPPSAGS